MKVIAPGYSGIEPGLAGVEALRKDPTPLAGLWVREVFNHLAKVVAALDTKPIIMGHSFGGAFVQLLLDAGFGAAGVSIDGAAVKGVLALPFSEVKAAMTTSCRRPSNARISRRTRSARGRSRHTKSLQAAVTTPAARRAGSRLPTSRWIGRWRLQQQTSASPDTAEEHEGVYPDACGKDGGWHIMGDRG
jgi:hypothetical protein